MSNKKQTDTTLKRRERHSRRPQNRNSLADAIDLLLPALRTYLTAFAKTRARKADIEQIYAESFERLAENFDHIKAHITTGDSKSATEESHQAGADTEEDQPK